MPGGLYMLRSTTKRRPVQEQMQTSDDALSQENSKKCFE